VSRLYFLVPLVVFASFQSSFGEERLEDMWRSNHPFEIRIEGADPDDPLYRCLDSGIALGKDRSTANTTKSRILCEAPWGRFAHFWSFDQGTTGETTTVLVDTDSGSWLKIVDRPEIEARGADEDTWAWQKRLEEVRDHLVTIETSTRLFDPFDAEVTEEARSVLWEDLQKSDPELAEMVVFLLEDLGRCRHPWCEALTRSVEKWVYGGDQPTSPEVVVRRLAGDGLEDPDDHEQSDFENDFGKWGDSFPDPP
jgi:hypothetical protein